MTLYRFSSPATFYALAGRLAPWFAGAAAICAAAGLWIGFGIAPTDFQQGDAYRIIFIHVPAAWMSMFVYLVMAGWSIVALSFNTRLSAMMAQALAPTGAWMTFIALWTGSLWGRPTWGTYWAWDARMTSELILLFLYFGGQYYVRIKTMRRVKKAEDRQKEYQTITNEAILSIANTIDAKDKYTNGHSRRVAKYAKAIASELGWPKDRIEKIYYTALLHDIGKIGIPDHILNKSGKLTGEEYAVIKTHTTIGYHILENMEIILYIKDGAYYHHERYDGKGYPVGLKGNAIPLVARIICVADSFDAMYSKRIYRDQFDIDYIINEL